jgi:hypothetical protein
MQITTVDSRGSPTDNVLASTTIADLPLSDTSADPQVVTGTFSNPASVVSGRNCYVREVSGYVLCGVVVVSWAAHALILRTFLDASRGETRRVLALSVGTAD